MAKRRYTVAQRKALARRSREWCKRHPEQRKAIVRRRRARLTNEVINMLGGKCACCGEDEPAFLTIHHLNDDGKEHRAMFGGNNATYLNSIKQDPAAWRKYAVLCANCHLGLTRKGKCPHEEC